MLTVNSTTVNTRLLDRWNRAITAAMNGRDKAALRTLAKTIATTAEALTGLERTRALALVARAEAGVRYLGTWRGWRNERRRLLRRAWRAAL